jgi:hypothetical protein
MKSPQTRINARTIRRDTVKDDATSLLRFLATGAIVLILSAVVLQVFDRTAHLADVVSDRIETAIQPAE